MSQFLRRAAGTLVALTLLAGAVPARATDLTVSAASSLTDAFQAIARAYEARYPGTHVALNFGASGTLLQQLAHGAPVDVFASADEDTMDRAAQAHLIDPASRRDCARNALVVVVPADSPLHLAALADLAAPAVRRIAIGQPASVPAGRYARRALALAHLDAVLEARLVLAQNVRQALDYVARGEVDAGLVYATDAAAARGRVRTALAVPLDVPLAYPVARVAASTSPEAQRFLDFLASPAARVRLAQAGFAPP